MAVLIPFLAVIGTLFLSAIVIFVYGEISLRKARKENERQLHEGFEALRREFGP